MHLMCMETAEVKLKCNMTADCTGADPGIFDWRGPNFGSELWVVCGLYTERWSYAVGWCLVT